MSHDSYRTLTLDDLHRRFQTMEGIAYRSSRALLVTTRPAAPAKRLLRLDERWRSSCEELERLGYGGAKDAAYVRDVLVTALRVRRQRSMSLV